MTKFTVKVLTAEGASRVFTRDADDERQLAVHLVGEHLTPIRITEQDGSLNDLLSRPVTFDRRVPVRDVALFCEQIGAMVGSGLTIEQALQVVSRQRGKRPSAAMARRLLPRIQAGSPLSDALDVEAGMPRYLPPMIRAAEGGSRLAEGLETAGRYLQRQASTRAEIANALTYPTIVLATVVVALLVVLTVVIPGFEPIFAGEEHRLPGMTRIVLWLSNLAVNHAAMSLFWLCAAVFAGLLLQRRSARFADWLAAATRRLPPVRLMDQLNVSRVLSVLGMLFQSGVEASEAVLLAAGAAGSKRLRVALEGASRQLREGGSIGTTLETVRVIPDETCALIEVGEHTGELGKTTLRAAQLLERDTSEQLERMLALVNPLAIAFLGVVVGLVVGGVMLGILSINQLALRS
ncbi:MAG: type II secretion system F family protein [Proteobacteria bacterium]|nr:type II secretion system F family protein [Pseudomonadota bacterium]